MAKGKGGKASTEIKQLTEKMIKFFKGALASSSESVRALAEIQENFKDEYEALKDFQTEPALLDKLVDKIDEDQKDVLILIMGKASIIGRKMNNLFDLSVEDKKQLADDIDDFSKFVEKKLVELDEVN